MPYKSLEDRKASGRRDYAKHRERRLAAKKIYHQKNRKKIRRKSAVYRAAHREEAKARTRAWHAVNLTRAKVAVRRWRLTSLYRITLEEHAALVRQQRGCCAICRHRKPLCIDHCHKKRRVRGLLCRKCNSGIGLLQDSVKTVAAALAYLKLHQT